MYTGKNNSTGNIFVRCTCQFSLNNFKECKVLQRNSALEMFFMFSIWLLYTFFINKIICLYMYDMKRFEQFIKCTSDTSLYVRNSENIYKYSKFVQNCISFDKICFQNTYIRHSVDWKNDYVWQNTKQARKYYLLTLKC